MKNERFTRVSDIDTELRSHQLKITGKIPHWLLGTMIRNGPGKFEVGSQKYLHWLDGLGMLHQFSIKNAIPIVILKATLILETLETFRTVKLRVEAGKGHSHLDR